MKTRIPGPEQIRSLSEMDRDALTDIYQQTTNLADRTALTWALGLAGNEQTVDLFKNTLTNEFKDRRLTSGKDEPSNEEAVLFDTVKNLGLLAARHDSARDFLVQSADPEFWKTNATWTTAGGNNTVGLLTLYSIMALAQSGRADVPDQLNTLAGRELLGLTPKNVAGGMTFEGSLVQAVYFDYYIKNHGLEKFQDDFVKQRQGTHWLEWAETEEGRQWQAWAGEMARKRLATP
ncbi:MAG: hypothetical protein HZA89_07265, partial [Verrucomicrobia bacterium]|nr:hypothetical protein [Verrucomicrobiota bacterium]